MLKLSACSCLVALALAADDPAPPRTIPLGGLRKVEAVITAGAVDYQVQVRMLPVHVFDPTTNAQLNRAKARLYALQALAKYLSDKKDVEYVVRGAQVDTVAMDGKFYVLTLRVPRDGIALANAGKEPLKPRPREQIERVAFTSNLFTRKIEYVKTLEQLTASLQAEVRAAEAQARELKNRDAFLIAVADVEDRGIKNYDALMKESQNDLLLLFTEKDELGEAVSRQKGSFLKDLKLAVDRFEGRTKKP